MTNPTRESLEALAGGLTDAQRIEADMGRKCADDVSSVMARNMALMQGAKAKFVVGTFGASVALAWASAALNEMIGDKATPGELIDGLFEKLRPMLLSSLAETRSHLEDNPHD